MQQVKEKFSIYLWNGSTDMNKVNNFILFILLATLSLYSQTNSILIIQPKGSQYKKLEMGIKNSLSKSISIKTTHSRNEAEIVNTINTDSPGLVVVMDMDAIRIWKKIQQKHNELNQIPSILLENDFSGMEMDNNPNSCIITYETKLEQYVNRFAHLTGKKPLNIGVVFSSKSSGGLVQSFQDEASHLGVNLHAKPVIISDPENSIKSIVKNFIDHYKIDFMIILNDDAVINNQNINTTWVSLLEPLSIPVAVPSDFFYELEPRIGSFAIQPHYSEIGKVVASVINEAQADNWNLIHKSVYTDKSIYYYRNENGSISRQNLLQNKLVASYHPKRTSPPPKAAAEPVMVAEKPKEPAPVIVEQASTVPVPSETAVVTEVKETAKEKAIVSVATNINPKKSENSTKKSENTPKKSENAAKTKPEDKHKKEKPESSKITKNIPKAPPSDADLQDNPPVEAPVTQFATANFDITITTDTANVYQSLASDFPVIGGVKKGDILKVKSEDSLWYCVDFSGTLGFVSKTEAEKYSEKSYFSAISATNLIMTIGIIIIASLILFLAVIFQKPRKYKLNGISCLLISRHNKMIKYSNINNNSISLYKYLRNYGFQIINSKNLNQASAFLHLNIPEIICVDWKLDTDIQEKMNDILRFKMLTADFLLIYYNVPTPSSIKKSDYFDDRTFFFGKNLTISDLNSVLSMIKIKPNTSQHNNDESKSCLEGKITEETLSEIFQMMDTNKKTGCLLVENHRPLGLIFFEEGSITFAVTDKLTAEEAVFEILSMKHGRFQFLPDKKPTTQQMQLDTLAVLMERAKLDDEIQTSFEPI